MAVWKGVVARAFDSTGFEQYAQGISLTDWRPRFLVLHNTAIPTFANWHNVSGQRRMNAFVRYYRDEQGWSAGPHLFVADDFIWVFTPLTTPGVHSPSWNWISWGVEVVGEYNTEQLAGAVLDNAISALATLHEIGGLNPATLRLHKEDPLTTHTDCPGSGIDKQSIIDRVSSTLAARVGGEHLPSRLASNV